MVLESLALGTKVDIQRSDGKVLFGVCVLGPQVGIFNYSQLSYEMLSHYSSKTL